MCYIIIFQKVFGVASNVCVIQINNGTVTICKRNETNIHHFAMWNAQPFTEWFFEFSVGTKGKTPVHFMKCKTIFKLLHIQVRLNLVIICISIKCICIMYITHVNSYCSMINKYVCFSIILRITCYGKYWLLYD